MNQLYIVMYHYTRDLLHSRYPKIKALDIRLFEQQLSFYEKNFQVVTMEMVMEAAYGQRELPERALLLTFDDGYIDNYTVAMPLLQKYHMQGSFFVSGKVIAEKKLLDVNKIHFILASADIHLIMDDLLAKMNECRGKEFDFPKNEELFEEYGVSTRFDDRETIFVKRMLQTVLPEPLRKRISRELFQKYLGLSEDVFARELYMNRDQMRVMRSAGMFIGVHGYEHYWLANLSKEKMEEDIEKGLDVLEEFIDPEGWVMNYPYGSYCEEVCSYARSKGAKLGLTTNVRVAKLGVESPMELPRLDCNDFPPKSGNYHIFLER